MAYLPPGTAVRYDGLEEGSPEYGAVAHCWLEDEIGAHDCCISFFGDKQPIGKPIEKPYVLRLALCVSTSLTTIDTAAD